MTATAVPTAWVRDRPKSGTATVHLKAVFAIRVDTTASLKGLLSAASFKGGGLLLPELLTRGAR